MTVRDVIDKLTICECTINGLTDMQYKACFSDSDTLQDAITLIKEYTEELKNKCIK